MPLTDYQATIVERSFTMGRGTSYPGVGGIKGAVGLPDVRDHDVAFELRDGAQAGADVYGQRVITIPVQIIADTEDALASLIVAAQQAWRPSSDDLELQIQFATGTKSYYGRPRGFSDANLGNHALIAGHALFLATFVCSDPFAYDTAVAVGADSSSPVVVPNAGNAVSRRVTLTVVGNGGVPTITNTTDPHAGDITFQFSVTGAETVVLDLFDQTATIGSTDVTSRVSIASLWTDLQPGNNTLTFSGCASVAASVRPAYQGN